MVWHILFWSVFIKSGFPSLCKSVTNLILDLLWITSGTGTEDTGRGKRGDSIWRIIPYERMPTEPPERHLTALLPYLFLTKESFGC